MVPHRRSRKDDEDLLDMLYMRDCGYTYREIGEKYNMNKNAVIGLLWRVYQEM